MILGFLFHLSFSEHCLEKNFNLLNEHKIKSIVIVAIHLITISYNFI